MALCAKSSGFAAPQAIKAARVASPEAVKVKMMPGARKLRSRQTLKGPCSLSEASEGSA